jgi:hypothetical protein
MWPHTRNNKTYKKPKFFKKKKNPKITSLSHPKVQKIMNMKRVAGNQNNNKNYSRQYKLTRNWNAKC